MRDRLYLKNGDRYRVRFLDATVVMARWRDDTMTFTSGRGDERRTVDAERIAAVSPIIVDGRNAQWFPFDHCYRSKFAPVTKEKVRWSHPYARVQTTMAGL